MKKLLCLLLLPIFLFAFMGCGGNKSDSNFLFGVTTFDKLAGGNTNSAIKQMKKMVADIESQITFTNTNSAVNRINTAKSGERVEVSSDIISLLKYSKEIYNDTNGAFNIAIYPLVEAWGFSSLNSGNYHTARPEPSQEILNSKNINLDDIEVYDTYIVKRDDDVKIDFGGIAKGYVADKCAKILTDNDVASGIINVGGNIYAYGNKPSADSYKIAVKHPRGGGYFGFLYVNNTSIVTSGDYERFYMYENKRYCHIIDPNTRKPVDNNIISVTIIDQDSTLADALSTAVFILGIDDGAALLESLGVKAVIVMDNNQYYASDGLDFELADSNYSALSR